MDAPPNTLLPMASVEACAHKDPGAGEIRGGAQSSLPMQEGDLVFFNTNGRGVSHVGVYLGNNKFIHASVSRGVMVSDLFDNYYLRRFVGAGRIDDKQIVAAE